MRLFVDAEAAPPSSRAMRHCSYSASFTPSLEVGSQLLAITRRGLEGDNLAEPLYRRAMRALAAKGNHAEALNSFRRCREPLPSDETDGLHRDIVALARRR